MRMVCGISFPIFLPLSGTFEEVLKCARNVWQKESFTIYNTKKNIELRTFILWIFNVDIFHANVNSAGLQE